MFFWRGLGGGVAIFEIGCGELQQGVLAAAFARGAVAAVLHSDGRLRRLWKGLLEDPAERLPWEAPLIDIARNHHGNSDITASLGDVYYFQPGRHGYIARKLEIDRSSGENQMEVRPALFRQGESRFAPSSDVMAECCQAADRIVVGMTPVGEAVRSYKIAVQRLKYQRDAAELGRLTALTSNSLGRWGRVGFTIDRHREELAGPLSRKGPADLMGMLMMMPVMRNVAGAANTLAGRFDGRRKVDPGDRVIEGPHCDSRLFTALCGLRENIRTEVYDGKRWEELPVGLESIAVFPGNLAQREYGLRPTVHRVLQSSGVAEGDARTTNVTLLLGAI